MPPEEKDEVEVKYFKAFKASADWDKHQETNYYKDSMAKLYFASNTELHEGHALVEDGVPGGVCWVICHGILAYALLFCGVGYKLLFYAMPYTAANYYRGILCFSMALAICSIIMIRTAHDKFIYHHVMLLRILPIAMIISGTFMTDALEESWLLVFWNMCWVIVLYVIDELCLEKYEVARKYTTTLEGWRDIEVVDWLTNMRFRPDVVNAFKGMDGPQLNALTDQQIKDTLPPEKVSEAADLCLKLANLRKYNPHHGHGHGHGHGGDHGDHGGGHGHGHGGGHGGTHDDAGRHETGGHGADVEMQGQPHAAAE